jgi:hypothetical protein
VQCDYFHALNFTHTKAQSRCPQAACELPASNNLALASPEIEIFTTGENVSASCHKVRQFVKRKSLLIGG